MADETPTNPAPTPAPTPEGQAAASQPAAEPPADKAAEAALKAAQDAIASLGDLTDTAAPAAAPAGAAPFELPSFSGAAGNGAPAPIDLLSDVDLQVKIELGRTRMLVEDVLKLADGAVIELDKLAGDPVDIYVNERHVARGEVLVLNDNFCVRINEILSASSDTKKAG